MCACVTRVRRVCDACESDDRAAQARELQREVFAAQMKMATELDCALIVHTREAEEDTLRLMREHLPRDARVHVHCFTSSLVGWGWCAS